MKILAALIVTIIYLIIMPVFSVVFLIGGIKLIALLLMGFISYAGIIAFIFKS